MIGFWIICQMNMVDFLAKRILLIFLLFFNSIYVQAETNPLVTDRPDMTESSLTVPIRTLQLETGIFYEFDKVKNTKPSIENQNLNLATTLIRYGLTKSFELRLGSEYSRQKMIRGNNENVKSGMNGLVVGSKLFLMSEQNLLPESALIVEFTTPVGNEDIAPEKTETKILLAMSHTLSDAAGLGYNLGYEKTANGLDGLIYSIALGMGLTPNIGVFGEIFGDKFSNSSANLMFDGGITYLLKPNLQFDTSLGLAFTDDAPDWFVNFGFVLRLPY